MIESELPVIILETAVQDDKVMQNFELESLPMRADHSQVVKAAHVGSDSSSKGCVNLTSSTAVSRIIDAYANGSFPCKKMAPIFSKLSREFQGRVKFLKLEVYQEDELATKLKIEKMPTLVFFKQGKLFKVHSGYVNKETLTSMLNDFLNSTL